MKAGAAWNAAENDQPFYMCDYLRTSKFPWPYFVHNL